MPALGCCCDDGRGDRMLARSLDTGGDAQQIVLLNTLYRYDRCDLRLAFGQRAGLVDHQGVDGFHPLQRFGIADQHAGMGAAPDANHDRHRRGEAQRTGAGDDQHAHRGHETIGKARLGTEHRPGAQRRGRR